METFRSWERLISAARLKGSEVALTVGHVSCVAMLARRSGNTNVRYPTEASRLALYTPPSSANQQSSCFAYHDG